MTTARITSRQNPRVKEAVRLRAGRERRKVGRHLIDGAREIRRALAAGVRPVEAFVCETIAEVAERGGQEGGGQIPYAREGGPSDSARREKLGQSSLVELLRRAGAEMLLVTAEVYEKLCFGERDQVGVVVVAQTPRRGLAELRLPVEPLVAVIEGVEKPGNVGAILRCADAAGVDAVVAADGGTDLFNPNTIRASLGTVYRANVAEAAADETVVWLRAAGLQIVVARPDAELDYTAVDLCGGVAIVLGSEAAGLSDAWRGADIRAVRLPMRGVADSLNVSTTAAVLFYEALRQRGETIV